MSTSLWITDDPTALPGLQTCPEHQCALHERVYAFVELPESRTDGSRSLYPFWGRRKAARRFVRRSSPAELRSLVWAATLGLDCGHARDLVCCSWLCRFLHIGHWSCWLESRPPPNVRASRSPTGSRCRSRSCRSSSQRWRSGPLAAFIVRALSNATDFRRPYLRWLVYTPVRALDGCAHGACRNGGRRQRIRTSRALLLASLAASATRYLAADAAPQRDHAGGSRSRVWSFIADNRAPLLLGCAPLRAARCALCLWLPRVLAVGCCRFLHPRTWPFNASSICIRSSGTRPAILRQRKRPAAKRQPLLRDRACGHARCTRSIHRGPLSGCRDLRERHRYTHGPA